ncbi:phospholipid carrier-dependent glycosyltransferase [Nostoc sp. FACHB-110]|uniref:glycosyltransferase family 39 protein n=1 Tax=Nostoc sp. FACHB-110 TaxID=2692834 RepID=UPI0016863FB1|nr:phospholipid carrier-dependent glycosyltransferase [Nostoc sp. FACHB-110]MBD2441212.1 phospholipid carrier-dependent glycosyltransferase [Nostoc sp. FACHB-110]
MKNRPHLLLLLLWLAIGTILRFSRLAALPPWTDECATIVFSLGNTFHTVTLNEIISSDILLQPLQVNLAHGINAVTQELLAESTHPPIYFALAHFWMKFFSQPGEIASIWVARSLSAVLGVLSIPAMFGFGYLTFRSQLVGQMAAAMMAVSPYFIFLSREARHYTLAILLVIASLCCCVQAIKLLHRQQSLSIRLVLTWVVINSLGIATHYFFSLTLTTEALVLLIHIWRNRQQNLKPTQFWRMGIVAIGTLIGCLVWIPFVQSIPSSDLTNWVAISNPHSRWLEPIGRLLLWNLSMLLLLPSALTSLPLGVVIASGVATLIFLIWSLPKFYYGLTMEQDTIDSYLGRQIICEYLLTAIGLCLFFTYALGKDLTLAARFQFIYAPAVILLLGAALAGCWQYLGSGKIQISIILLIALFGGITVDWNLGYLQNQRPDILASLIHQVSRNDVLIATKHIHHGQTGRMMGLAWEFQTQPDLKVKFFLAGQDANRESYTYSVQILQETIAKIKHPLDLWLVEFRTPIEVNSQQCILDNQFGKAAGEYSFKLYHCASKNSMMEN